MRLSPLAVILVSPFALAAIAPATLAQDTANIVHLLTLHDTARPLLIFAPRPDHPQLQIQLRGLHEDAAGLTDRNIVIIALPYNSPSPTPATLTAGEAQQARRRFGIAPSDFCVILLGKDGTEKLRSIKPLSMEKLRSTIDAMPMRQQEMHPHPHPTP